MKVLWGILGVVSIIAGFIGLFVPILPTTPFAILAAFCFSKSSERLHTWLLETKMFGPLIKDWETSGVIRPRIKILATTTMSLLFSYTLIFVQINNWIKISVSIIGIAALFFIWTRPSIPTSND